MEEDVPPKKLLPPMLKRPGNDRCVDCGAADPDWASTNLGIFLCLACSGIHRNLGVHISRVKSVRLDNWKAEEVDTMDRIGNEKAKQQWEKALPPFFPSPTESDHINIKEQWIRAKYDRAEFDGHAPPSGLLERLLCAVPRVDGFITKRGNRVKTWKKRWAVMLGSMLLYFKKQTDVTCQGHLHLKQATGFSGIPDLDGYEFAWIIQTPDRDWHMSAPMQQDMFEWISAMRCAKARLVDGMGGTVTSSSFDVDANLDQMRRDIGLMRLKFGKAIKECFLGSQLVDWLMSAGGLASRTEAAAVGQSMLGKSLFSYAGQGAPGFDDGFQGYVWRS